MRKKDSTKKKISLPGDLGFSGKLMEANAMLGVWSELNFSGPRVSAIETPDNPVTQNNAPASYASDHHSPLQQGLFWEKRR